MPRTADPRPTAAIQRAATRATETGEGKETRKHDSDSVERMAEEQHEALDEGDLDEEEGQAQGKEIEPEAQPVYGSPECAPAKPERQQDQDGAEDRGLDERRHQDQVAPVEHRGPTLGAQRQEFGQGAPAEKVEEIGPIVSGRRNIELVALGEVGSLRAEEGEGSLVEIFLVELVVAVHVARGDARRPGDVKEVLGREAADGCDVFGRERRLGDEQGCSVPAPDQRQVPAWLGHAIRFKRCGSSGEKLEDVARRHPQPSRDGDDSIRSQHSQVILQCLHGVGVVLMHALHAGRGRAEGIKERHLDQVVTLASSRSEGARLG